MFEKKIHARENVRKKNSWKGKCPEKKIHARENVPKKIHAQDGPHFDMKP